MSLYLLYRQCKPRCYSPLTGKTLVPVLGFEPTSDDYKSPALTAVLYGLMVDFNYTFCTSKHNLQLFGSTNQTKFYHFYMTSRAELSTALRLREVMSSRNLMWSASLRGVSGFGARGGTRTRKAFACSILSAVCKPFHHSCILKEPRLNLHH